MEIKDYGADTGSTTLELISTGSQVLVAGLFRFAYLFKARRNQAGEREMLELAMNIDSAEVERMQDPDIAVQFQSEAEKLMGNLMEAMSEDPAQVREWVEEAKVFDASGTHEMKTTMLLRKIETDLEGVEKWLPLTNSFNAPGDQKKGIMLNLAREMDPAAVERWLYDHEFMGPRLHDADSNMDKIRQATVWLLVADAFRDLGDYQSEMKVLKLAMEKDPARVWYELAKHSCFERTGRWRRRCWSGR